LDGKEALGSHRKNLGSTNLPTKMKRWKGCALEVYKCARHPSYRSHQTIITAVLTEATATKF